MHPPQTPPSQSDGSGAVMSWPPPGLVRMDNPHTIPTAATSLACLAQAQEQRAAEKAVETAWEGYGGGWGSPPFSLATHPDAAPEPPKKGRLDCCIQ